MNRLSLTALFFVFLTYWTVNAAPIPTVTVLKTKIEDVSDTIRYPVQITSIVDAQMLSEVEGTVTKIQASPGDRAQPGKTLLTIQRQDPVYQYAPFNVQARVSGQVAQIFVTTGASVGKGTPLVRITDPTRLRLSAEIVAADLHTLKQGAQGELFFAGEPKRYKVRLQSLSQQLDSTTQTAQAFLEFTEKNTSVLASAGFVEFKVNQHKAIRLPSHAFIYKDQKTFVRVVEDGKAKFLPVETIKTSGDAIEIKEGLKEGKTIIERSNLFIKEGDAVQIEST